jgi:hypothetical protein
VGVPYETFWNLNPKKLKPFYKAYQLKLEEKNNELWLLGAYTYNAIISASPIFNPFAKKGTKPLPYLDKPFEVAGKKEEIIKVPEQTKIEQERIKGYLFLNNWARATNEKLKKKE